VPTQWEDKYQLNIKDIDAQHRKFFEYLESTDPLLELSELNEQDVYKIMRLLISWRSYGLLHFYTEEKLMIDAGYPEYLSHLDLHDDFMSKMSAQRLTFLGLFKEFKEGADKHAEIMAFLKEFVEYGTEWFQSHISEEDAKYAYFIKQK